MMSQAAYVNVGDDVLRFVCHAKRSRSSLVHVSRLEHCCSSSNVPCFSQRKHPAKAQTKHVALLGQSQSANEDSGSPCRCLPVFSTALLNEVVSAAHPAVSLFVSNSSSPYYNYLNGAGQRLERHIADIQKGFAVIIVSGTDPVALSSSH